MDPGQVVKDVAPSLLEFVSPRDIKTTTVTAGLARRAWVRQISGGITTPAILDYFRLWDLVSQLQLGDNEDNLIWRWTVDGKYTSKSAYQALLTASHPVPGCSRIWKTWAPFESKSSYGSLFEDSTRPRTGGDNTGYTQTTTATSATKILKPSTTSSPRARTRTRSGGPC